MPLSRNVTAAVLRSRLAIDAVVTKARPRPSGDTDGYVRVLTAVVNDTLTADYWAITLPNELATSASKSPALLAYIAALNILDADALLSTGKVRSRLDPAITARKGIERHHIIPRAYLKHRLGIADNKEINQIANMALVKWADNIAISNDAPPVYWPAQVAAKQITGDRLAQQMYWHALPDGWEQLEYTDFLSRRRRLMAEVVRDAFTLLHDSGYQPVYPQVAPPAAEPATRTWTAYSIRVVDLIDADLLPAGTQLVSTLSTVDALATVLPDGKIAYDGEVYDTPSAAAVAARNGHANGWTFWAADTPDGRFTLAALRDLYMQQRSS